jgi:hypothetical protein
MSKYQLHDGTLAFAFSEVIVDGYNVVTLGEIQTTVCYHAEVNKLIILCQTKKG